MEMRQLTTQFLLAPTMTLVLLAPTMTLGTDLPPVAQPAPLAIPKEWPTTYWPAKDWPWPELEAVHAAPRNHKLLWENDQIRLVEVTIPPGETSSTHAYGYPAVLAFDAPLPSGSEVNEKSLIAGDTRNNAMGIERAAPPPGKQYPTCTTSSPQAPLEVTNNGKFPIHFYRIEYKRIEGYDFQQHWQQWHAWMLRPLKPIKDLVPGPALGPPYSEEWPYPIAYESVRAAPNDHQSRYEDSHVRLLEVSQRPDQSENMHGHQFSSVVAADTPQFGSPAETEAAKQAGKSFGTNIELNKTNTDAQNNQPGGFVFVPSRVAILCHPAGVEAPRKSYRDSNDAGFAVHFYRLEFKRIDGDDIKARWREWYPSRE